MIDPLAINPGDFRTPISIVRKSPAVKDIAAQPNAADYQPVYSATCRVMLTRSAEPSQNDDLISQNVYKVRMWMPAVPISAGMIAQINGVNYDITNVDDVQKRGRVLELVIIAIDESVG